MAQMLAKTGAPTMEYHFHRYTYSRTDIEKGIRVKELTGKMPLNPRNYNANSHEEVDWAWVADVDAYYAQYQFHFDEDERKAILGL